MFQLSAEFYRQVCQESNLGVQGNILGIFFPRILTYKTFRLLAEKRLTGLKKVNDTCPEEDFEAFILGKRTYNFSPFPDF